MSAVLCLADASRAAPADIGRSCGHVCQSERGAEPAQGRTSDHVVESGRRRPWGGGGGGGQSPWGARSAAAQFRGDAAPAARIVCAASCRAASAAAAALLIVARCADRAAVARQRHLSRRARRAGHRAALRRLSTAPPRPASTITCRRRSRGADAEGHARQPRRGRLPRATGPAAARTELPEEVADAHRRREHRRHQFHRVLGDQGRRGLSLQHPQSRRHGESRRPRARCAR